MSDYRTLQYTFVDLCLSNQVRGNIQYLYEKLRKRVQIKENLAVNLLGLYQQRNRSVGHGLHEKIDSISHDPSKQESRSVCVRSKRDIVAFIRTSSIDLQAICRPFSPGKLNKNAVAFT